MVVDSDHKVAGMITRKDLTQRRLDKLWEDEVCYFLQVHIIYLYFHPAFFAVIGSAFAKIYKC